LISGSNIAQYASLLKVLNALDELIKLLNFFETVPVGWNGWELKYGDLASSYGNLEIN
jgi:hypothetical protein